MLACSLTVDTAAPSWFTTTTGRHISISELSRHFHGVPQDQWHFRIFEITSDDQLVTSTGRVRLAEHPFRLRLFMPTDDATAVINERVLHQHSFRYLSKTVNGITISYRLDKTPFSIASTTSVFRPLHRAQHPGVFIDTRKVYLGNHSGGNDALALHNDKNGSSGYDSSATTSTCRRGDPEVELELGITFDISFCSLFGDILTTLAIVTDTVHMGMIPFHRQTCVRPKIVYYEGYCGGSNDPYAQNVSNRKRCAFCGTMTARRS